MAIHIFVLATALLASALRNNRAHTRYWLWLIASLKFLVPFSFLVAIGKYVKWPVTAPASHAAISAAVQQIGQPFAPQPVFAPLPQAAAPVASIPTGAILFAIWACGCGVVLLSWLRGWMRVRSAVRNAVPLPLEAPIPALSSSSLLEPGVFGIFHPVLLLPANVSGQLSAAHFEAILAHEFCHIRRRDNLAAAIHMLVEALFWFHPMVWWIGSRLVEERERACDEEVLRLGNRPQVYAESILKVCQLCIESPLACVSGITGSDLKKRIVRIMTGGIAVRLSFRKKLLLAAAASAAIILPLAAGLLNAAQSPSQPQADTGTPRASFEVASIKPSDPAQPGTMIRIQPGGRFTAKGINVKTLLLEAYNLQESQISGAPGWLNSDRWDIQAKPEDSVGAALDKLTPEQRKDKVNADDSVVVGRPLQIGA